MYYLPVYLNNRRMHIVKLDRATDNQTLFSFLVNASDHYDVFSLPSNSIQLICDNGENVDLKEVNYTLEKVDSQSVSGRYRDSEGIPIYNIKMCRGNGQCQIAENLSTCFDFVGNLGDSMAEGEIPFTLKARYQALCEEYILQFSYEDTDQYGNMYSYVGAIRICEYKAEAEVFKASLDFGSEASQVHLSTAKGTANMNIRDAFIGLVGGDVNQDYWQGRSKGDERTLYKSIYHIHKRPAKTEFGDLPMNNGKRTFLQSLLEITAPTEDFILLPNLKLIEQLNLVPNMNPIDFHDGGFMGNGKIDLTNSELNDGILRQILCNFLSVVMNSDAQRKYIYFILLVPNVYSQEKVNKLIIGLYDDFNLLRKNERFKRYKGIEVSIVSESDASFFGIRALAAQEELPWIKNAHYLIIDAGKGTTDFSLLAQKGKDLASYNSLYRSGIPASGHVLTYAFYEALRKYFYGVEKDDKSNYGESFDNIMRAAVGKETAEVLEFVSLLEQFKVNYTSLKEDPKGVKKKVDSFIKNEKNSLGSLNTFLQSILKDNQLIPGMTAALESKIQIMTNLIKNSIVAYAKARNFVCQNVFLTGRAFMLRPFKDAVSKMLEEEGIVRAEGIFYRDILTKSMCTYGAMKVGIQSVVNKNSNMLGSPNLVEEFGEDMRLEPNQRITNLKKAIQRIKNLIKTIKTFVRKIIRMVDKGVGVEMSFDFFYEGLKLSNVRQAVFSLSGKDTLIGTGYTANLQVYYIGDGYLWKQGNTCRRIDTDGPIYGIPDNIRARLVRESNFPFDIVSFGLDDIPEVDKNDNQDSGSPNANANANANVDTNVDTNVDVNADANADKSAPQSKDNQFDIGSADDMSY